MLEDKNFDTGLSYIKVEDDEYDEETYVEDTEPSDDLSQDSEGSSRTVRLAQNQEELDSIDRWTQELMKLETFYNQDPLRYLNEGDSDFEDLDVGHVVTKADFSLAVESDYLDPKTFQESWYYNDLEIQEKWRNPIRKEIRDMIRRGV